jgi:hypothetical protein
VNLALEGILIEQLAAGHAVEFRARLGQAILVGVLHLGLARRQRAEHRIVKRQIKRRRAAPDEGDRDQRNQRPQRRRAERDGADAVGAGARKEILQPEPFRRRGGNSRHRAPIRCRPEDRRAAQGAITTY